MMDDVATEVASKENEAPENEDQEIPRLLARTIWAVNQKLAAPDETAAEDSAEDAGAGWNEARPNMMRVARMTMRRLEAKGISLVKAKS